MAVKAHAQGQELVIIKDRNVVDILTRLFIQLLLNTIHIHQTGDAGDHDKFGLGLVDNRIQLGLDKGVRLSRRGFREPTSTAAALILQAIGINSRAQGLGEFTQDHRASR